MEPQARPLAEEVEVDFGQVITTIAGLLMKISMFEFSCRSWAGRAT